MLEFQVSIHYDESKLKGSPVFKFTFEPVSIWSASTDADKIEEALTVYEPLHTEEQYLIMQKAQGNDTPTEIIIDEHTKDEIIRQNKINTKNRQERLKQEKESGKRIILTPEQEKEEWIRNVWVRHIWIIDTLDMCLYLAKYFKYTDVDIINVNTGQPVGNVDIIYTSPEGKEVRRRISRDEFSLQAQQYMHRYI
jgi:hypothetical protein